MSFYSELKKPEFFIPHLKSIAGWVNKHYTVNCCAQEGRLQGESTYSNCLAVSQLTAGS